MTYASRTTPAFVRGVFDQTVENGFGDSSPDVAASLPYTTGAVIDAARSALQGGIACARMVRSRTPSG
jgi:hypothetical protein